MCRMENPNQNKILPSPSDEDKEITTTSTQKRKRPTWPLWTFLGILGLVAVAAISAFSGYRSGINLRTDAKETQVASEIQQQFDLAQQDIANKQYDRARQRLQYVIQLDPQFPGAAEKLSDVLLELNTTATPTAAPTPTLTPTPDTRGVDELFSQAQSSLANSDWSTTIDTLLTLRKNDPNYQTVAVDDMLFLALRNRGADKILKEADLEGGIYDLSLAERFGPLDTEAESYLTWARIYILGASFWQIDWKQAVYYFEQVAPQLPNLRDGSGMTATERYRKALIGYGDSLLQDDPCAAVDQYQQALSLGSDPDAEDGLNKAEKECSGNSDKKSNNQENNNSQSASPTNTPEQAQPTTAPQPTEAPQATQEPTAAPQPTEAPTSAPQPTEPPQPTAAPTEAPQSTEAPQPTATSSS